MKAPLAAVAALLALTTVAEAGTWVGQWQVNQQLHNRWWMRPVDSFFAVNGGPSGHWDNNGGIVGIGSHYSWQRSGCKVLIRVSPTGMMESLNSYGSCGGKVR